MEGIGLPENITNEQLFDFMTKMYGEMQEGFGQLNSRMDNMEGEIKKTNAKIEYKDPSFDPAVIQKEIKEQSQKNPSLVDSQKSAKE